MLEALVRRVNQFGKYLSCDRLFFGIGQVLTIGVEQLRNRAKSLENAAIGDFIRVRNIESGLIVSGTVMDNGSIRVAAK